MKTVFSREKGGCLSRQIVVRCLPAVEFEVSILFVDKLQSRRSARLAPGGVEEMIDVLTSDGRGLLFDLF